jgi:DNA-binding NarL/FixJ family response regulator
MTTLATVPAEAPTSRPLRVLAVDDQSLFLDALGIVLSAASDLQIVGRASDGAEGLQLALSLRPDVVLMDVEMPRLDGFEATRKITTALPETAVVIVTGSTLAGGAQRARTAGAAGYVTKDQLATTLAASIRAAAAAVRGA